MNIMNSCNEISEKQIEQLIGLLKEDVKNMEGTIIVFESMEDVMECFPEGASEEYLDSIRRGEEKGIFSHDSNLILLYSFNIFSKEEQNPSLDFAFILFHELRHMYQAQYLTEKYLEEKEWNEEQEMPYVLQWCEVDANYFATKWMMENKKEIQTLLGKSYDDYEKELSVHIRRYERYQKYEISN